MSDKPETKQQGGIMGAAGAATGMLGGLVGTAAKTAGSGVQVVTKGTADMGEQVLGKDNLASNLVKGTGDTLANGTNMVGSNVEHATGAKKQ